MRKNKQHKGRNSPDNSQTFVKTVETADITDDDSDQLSSEQLEDQLTINVSTALKKIRATIEPSQLLQTPRHHHGTRGNSPSKSSSSVVDQIDILSKFIEMLIPVLVTTVKTAVESVLKTVAEQRPEHQVSVNKEQLTASVIVNKYENDKLEQYSRRENLRLYGVKEDQEEDLQQTVIDIAGEVGVQIDKSDINVCHRLGHKPTGQDQRKPRGIICRFLTREPKVNILKKKYRLKNSKENKNVFITEDLTVLRSRLVRAVKNIPNVSGIHTNDGRVHCTDSKGKHVVLETPDDLFLLGVDNVDYKAFGLERYMQ